MKKKKKLSEMTIGELESIIKLFFKNCHYSPEDKPFIYNPYCNGDYTVSDHTEIKNEK